MKKFLGLMAAASLAVTSLGCATTEVEEDTDAPEFTDGQGDARWLGEEVGYPEGPYGVIEGQVVANVPLMGYYDFVTAGAVPERIEFADFYNPTGDAIYGEGHPYAGKPLPKVLILTRSAVWCGPCNAEAGETMSHRDVYGDDVMFITTLFDDGNPQEPGRATFADLTSWGTAYAPNYPITLDPDSSVADYYPQGSIPGIVVIRTSDMRIMHTHNGLTYNPNNGALDPIFWGVVDSIIAE